MYNVKYVRRCRNSQQILIGGSCQAEEDYPVDKKHSVKLEHHDTMLKGGVQ